MIVGHLFREFVMRSEDVDLGREVVADGRLKQLRTDLGLSRQAMAELLHTSTVVYASWESRAVKLWPSTAERVGRFYRRTVDVLYRLNEDGIPVSQLMPLHLAASQVGVPHELFMSWYRDGYFEAVDLGILGLWLYREDINKIRVPKTTEIQ